MDEIQKKKIFEMRMQGIGYKKIAKEMDMNVDSIKVFCRRNNLKGSGKLIKMNYEVMEDTNIICKHCNKRIRKRIKGRSKKFCSDYCRRKWWKENPDKRKKGKNAIYKFTCPNCGNEFSSYGNKKRSYCSNKCYVRARFYKEEDNGTQSSENG